jgi:ABC-2 type transport system ATP-binding protein
MLRVSNLSKKFGDFQVLKNININAEKNQIYGLVGSNGCGKTTILKHIMQVYKQDEGYIAFDEEEVDKNSDLIKDFYYVQDTLYFPYQQPLGKRLD